MCKDVKCIIKRFDCHRYCHDDYDDGDDAECNIISVDRNVEDLLAVLLLVQLQDESDIHPEPNTFLCLTSDL